MLERMSFGQPDSLSSLGKTGKECTDTSIVKALDEFMGAMTRMQSVVMIPSRLKDVEAPLPSGRRDHSSPPSRASSSIALSLDSALVAKATPVRAASLDGQSAPADLFSCYRMLDSVRHELLSGDAEPRMGDSGLGSLGEATDDDLSSLDSVDLRETESQLLAAKFRLHLNGLYQVMNQLTQTANLVSDKYQDEVYKPPTSS